MPHYCCVPLCTSDKRREDCKDISFFAFPRDNDICKKWIVAIRRDPGPYFQLTKNTRVCSKHFHAEDYEASTEYSVRRRIKKTSVPSVFDWSHKERRRKLIRKQEVIQIPKKVISSDACLNIENHDEHLYFDTASCDEVTDSADHADAIINSTETKDENICTSEAKDINGCTTEAADASTRATSESTETNEASEATDDAGEPDILDTSAESEHSTDSLEHIQCDPSPDKKTLQEANLQLLELRNKEKFSVLRFCSSDSEIRFYTGFCTYTALNSFFHFLLPEAQFLYYVGTDNTSDGVPYALLNKRGRSRSLSPLEEMFITIMRLRKGFQERHIAHLYCLSEGHVSKIVSTWILFLADRLRYLPIWPTKEHIEKTMPAIFKEHFPSTRAIVDCTEIFIEHPSAADCQRETFSSYKHNNTAKGLITISPNGLITFVSPLYAGRCSDKKIIRHCGLLDLLEEGDGLMVDRGFDISNDLETRGIQLIIPSFLNGLDQFTEDQLSNSRSIATVRVHVERAMRKIKEFEILSNTVPITMCPILEKIWYVCAYLSNFTGTGSLFKQN